MLKIRGLKKTYGNGVRALGGIDLDVPAGMFGLLGPNGAGKTTLMKILATLLAPDEGSAGLNGVDLVVQKGKARRVLGYLPQEFVFYPTLTAEQTLDYFIKLKGVTGDRERRTLADALLERVTLSSARKQRVGGFSGGMRQRLGIAQALIGRPELLIVDEPTAGLDPEERNRFHNLLSETASENALRPLGLRGFGGDARLPPAHPDSQGLLSRVSRHVARARAPLLPAPDGEGS